MPASASHDPNGIATLTDVPSLISARSANTTISENRPTRIQAETLLILNGLLDELLLSILTSAKSLATDRIKTDGMLRVFSSNLLAKDAILEAELELRSYVDGKRAEGARVPLGLMATSRLDGTDNFPVKSAYKALRTRCQYYSTLSDYNDEGAAKDQNIMSSDGRPIATVTPGASIYVTALLEFVGVHILQNVARVIERDNSDEASLYDLHAAITEDEQLNPVFGKMSISQELTRRIDILESRHRKKTDGGTGQRIVKPWQVPDERDFDEAAGPNLFSSKRASMQPSQHKHSVNGHSSTSSSSRHDQSTSSSLGHADSMRGSISTLRTSSSVAINSHSEQNGVRPSLNLGSANGASHPGGLGRRQSSERSWSGVFGGIKRRNSFKHGSETPATRLVLPSDNNTANAGQAESALDPDDDFEALMLSGQTMKVSLTPNRLHTIEVAKKSGRVGVESTRQQSQISLASNRGDAGDAVERKSMSSATPSDVSVARPSSRASLQTATRPERRAAAPPPSSYRSPSPLLMGKHNMLTREVAEEDGAVATDLLPVAPSTTSAVRRMTPRLQPRDDEAERKSSTHKDLVDLFRSTPPSATSDKFGSTGSETSSLTDAAPKKLAVGDRVRTLFGRRSTSSTGHGMPSSPIQKAFREHQRVIAAKASLEGSQDTYVSSSTTATNSIDQHRSLVSPNEGVFNPNAASRSSTSTSEHPAISADAAVEAKTTAPEAAVVEPSPSTKNANVGLGVGMDAMAGAAGAALVAASRSASNGSRSTSYGSRTHGSAEAVVRDELAADDTSTTSKSPKTAEELVSRKVPWGYKRNSTSASTVIERNGTPSSDRRRSVGYTSSNGHGVLSLRGQAGTPSSDAGHVSVGAPPAASPTTANADEGGAWPATPASWTSRGTNAPTAWSALVTASRSQSLVRRGSIGAKPAPVNQSRRPSTSLETIQVLAELEKAMRNCHSVDECRALVQKAMHSGGLPVSPSGSRGEGDADANTAHAETKPDTSAENASEAAAAGAIVADGVMATAKATETEIETGTESEKSAVVDGNARGLRPSYKAASLQPPVVEEQSSSLETVEQGLIVAWLLGGDDGPASSRTIKQQEVEQLTEQQGQQQGQQHVDGVVPAVVEEESGGKAEAAGVSRQEASLDSTASLGDAGHHASSSVASLQSNYKDAEEGLPVE